MGITYQILTLLYPQCKVHISVHTLKTELLPQNKHEVLVNMIQLKLYCKIIGIHCHRQTEHTSTMCSKNAQFCNDEKDRTLF